MTGLSSRLRQLAATPPGVAAAEERCNLCGEALAGAHRHVLDVRKRQLRCACRACAILFDRGGAGHYRLVPERYRELRDLAVDDSTWDRLGIPVATAFFFWSTPAGRVVAFYPGPMGAMECALDLDAYRTLAEANPVVAGMEPDVEALLVHRARSAREHWLVPVDACYRLVAVIRIHWTGFSGGERVWSEIRSFFEGLRKREAACQSRTTSQSAIPM